jgi:HlyD family secretion protein
MNKHILISIITIVSAVIIVTCYFFYKYYIAKTSKQPEIKTIKVQYEPSKRINARYESQSLYHFYLEPKHGYINNWLVKNETQVHKNQPLFEYYNPTVEKAIALKQQLLATLTHDSEHTQDNNQLIALQNDIATLQQNLRTKIIAPFDGTLTINNSNPSTPQSHFATLYQPKYHISAKIPETYMSTLKLGTTLKIHSSHNDQFNNEKITHISTIPSNYATADKQSQYEIRLTSSAKPLLGQHCELEIPSTTIAIPQSALLNNKYVFIKKSNKFVKRVIKFNKSGNNNRITVKSGLSPGDIIVENANSLNTLN